ncbi:MAG: hypothetical protein IKB99_08370 [Lentisphaeria bacterium]|nr:hypothetical protein [Lentisphaeria bacterium]
MAYLDEISIDAGRHPIRKEPVLAAERYYDKLLLKDLKEKNRGNSS